MTSHERMTRFMSRQPHDRIPVYEHFWGDTVRHYREQGHLGPNEGMGDHFDYDIHAAGAINFVADLDFVRQRVSEDADTYAELDGNGAILRRHKWNETTPEHVDFTIKDYSGWKELKKLLKPEERRINFEGYRNARQRAQIFDKYFCFSLLHVFELMHPVIGHETMLACMALEPDFIQDMCETYCNLLLELQHMLFEREGYPDAIWYYEDLGFKGRPFMSPAMFNEYLVPWYKKTFDYAHSHDMPVILHSCGYIEPLLDGLVEAGIDCLQVIEVKAGNDLLRIYEKYGDRLSFMGGIDVRAIYSNDRATIDAELEAKIPIVKGNYGFCLHSDHSIPKTVDFEAYEYFVKRGIELGTY